MADNRYDDETLSRGAERPITDADHLLPDHTSVGEPGQVAATDNPDATRAEIDRTRARMSRTLDSIESALLRKKEQIQERLDVMAPVRERPLVSVGAVFGGALVLGYLTGGGDDRADDEAPDARLARGATGMPLPLAAHLDDDEADLRAELWEKRARRLLRVARSQEEELASLRGHHAADDEEGDFSGMRALGSNAAEMRDGVIAAVAGFLTEAFNKLRDGAEHVAEAVHDGYDSVRDHAGDGLEAVADRVGDLKERAMDGLDAVKDRAPGLVDAARDRAGDGLDAVKDRVEDLRG